MSTIESRGANGVLGNETRQEGPRMNTKRQSDWGSREVAEAIQGGVGRRNSAGASPVFRIFAPSRLRVSHVWYSRACLGVAVQSRRCAST